jgi:hypothetical protein
MAKTFKQLQDSVLEWMADENDTGLMRTLVKQSLDKSQRRLLSSEQLDFMLSPLMTLNVTVGRTSYALPENFLSMLFVRQSGEDPTYLEEIPPKALLEAEDGFTSSEGQLSRFRIVAINGVQRQPTVAGVVVVTPSGGNEAAANGVVIQGLDSTGQWVEETLSSGSTWASLTSTTSFQSISNIIKTGATWTRTITVTSGSVTLLTLAANEWVKQYQQLELVQTPTTTHTLQYQYYVKPIDLVYDYQLPQVPDAYRDVLEYDALLLLPGFTRATAEEMESWQRQSQQLHLGLKQNYQQSRSLGARARRIRMIERV